MGTIAGIIASFAASHLGGLSIGGLLAGKGWLGFAGQAGKLVVKRRMERKAKKAQADLANWLDENNGED
jgi:hypothetical protein